VPTITALGEETHGLIDGLPLSTLMQRALMLRQKPTGSVIGFLPLINMLFCLAITYDLLLCEYIIILNIFIFLSD
jgi:hypothetical protein